MLRLILLMLCCVCLTASAAELVAIGTLKASGVTENEALSLTDALRSELARAQRYQIMERGQMEEILKEQGFQASGTCDEASCAIEMGKILAVKYIMLGNIGKVGKTFTLSVRFVDVATGEILKDFTEYHKGAPDELLTRVVPLIAQKITGGAVQKKSPVGWWIAGGTVAAGAGIVAAVVVSKKPDDGGQAKTSDLNFSW